MQEAAFSRRVARSAKDLTLASLSGVTDELKDPRSGKQSGSSTQIPQQHKDQHSEPCSRSRPHSGFREDSFRTQVSASASKAAEEDFDRFQDRGDFRDTWQVHDIAAQLAASSMAGPSQELEHEHLNTGSWHFHRESELSAGDIADIPDDAKPLETVASEDQLTSGAAHMESSLDITRAAARRRLDQISAHLQRNLALQALQQDIDVRAQDILEMIAQTSNERRLSFDEMDRHATHTSHSEQANNLTHSSHPIQHHYPLPPNQPTLKEERDEQPQYSFNCPYYECHRILKRLEPNSLSSDLKPCVHEGCWFHAEGMEAWIEHIKLPHHDLQGEDIER